MVNISDLSVFTTRLVKDAAIINAKHRCLIVISRCAPGVEIIVNSAINGVFARAAIKIVRPGPAIDQVVATIAANPVIAAERIDRVTTFSTLDLWVRLTKIIVILSTGDHFTSNAKHEFAWPVGVLFEVKGTTCDLNKTVRVTITIGI